MYWIYYFVKIVDYVGTIPRSAAAVIGGEAAAAARGQVAGDFQKFQ